MEFIQAFRQGLTSSEPAQGLLIAIILSRFLESLPWSAQTTRTTSPPSSTRVKVIKTAGFFFIFLAARSWLALVDEHAPEPYLVSTFS